MTVWRSVRKVKFSGKWVDVWLGTEDVPHCCKGYMLQGLLDGELLDAVDNHGWRCIEVLWPDAHDRPIAVRLAG